MIKRFKVSLAAWYIEDPEFFSFRSFFRRKSKNHLDKAVPEGTGYRAKTRFSKFYNLPELLSVFKESADIQTADMLKLPVPEAEYENIVLKPSEAQQDMVAELAERAENVRNGSVNPRVDNMLKITNDGRKLALDQRLIDPELPDTPDSKANVCVEKAFDIWEKTKAEKSTQILFCDLSTPKSDGSFNVYDDIRQKLVAKGVPEKEIAFIHDADTEAKKTQLFEKVRNGEVRFLLGSTSKLGAGTNVQDRLIALHHIDVPWRPSDIEQQEGRILRQGNKNDKVKIFRYVTEGTFDAYMWQTIENKQKFIGQIMTSKSPVRSCDDVDDTALTYAEVKALAAGNPQIKEKMDLDVEVAKLKVLRGDYQSQKYRLEDMIACKLPQEIAAAKERIEGLEKDIATFGKNRPADAEHFSMTVGGRTYAAAKDAGKAIADCLQKMLVQSGGIQKLGLRPDDSFEDIGSYCGFPMQARFNHFVKHFQVRLAGAASHMFEAGLDPSGNIRRINNLLSSMPEKLETAKNELDAAETRLKTAKDELTKPFPREDEYNEKVQRLNALNALLSIDARGTDNVTAFDDEEDEQKSRSRGR